MQLTEKNLMCGDYLQYYIGEEGCEWDYTKVDWQDLKWAVERPDNFNKVHRPITLSEEILRKIEGVKEIVWSKEFRIVTPKNIDVLISVQLMPSGSWQIWIQDKKSLDAVNVIFTKEYHLHQLQQLCRCLGHELVINF